MIVPTLLLAVLAADSASARDTVITLPEVRVESVRLPLDAHGRMPTAFVTDLTAGQAGRAIESLPDLLAEAAGVRIQQYGGLGAFSTVSLRGASAGQVTVFLDGVPLTSAAHGVVSLSDLPATAVERVEVYRGLGPLGLGVATPGGAINLVTASDPGLRELRVARGSFGTWEARASAGRRLGPVTGFLHTGYQGSAGDFRYLDDNGTPFNANDDSVTTRVNGRFDAATALASLGWAPRGGWRVTARQEVFHRAQGMPGLGATPALTARLGLERAMSVLQVARTPSPAARLVPRAELRGSLDRERSRLRDTGFPDRGELGVGRHDTDDHLAADEVTGTLEWRRPLPALALETAGTLRFERARLTDAADAQADPPASRRRTAGAMAGLRIEPLGDRVTLHAARRWDRVVDTSDDGARTARELASPQLGARVRGPLGFEARANWTRAERVPDFMERFGNLGGVQGNPALRPERAESWDAGGSWRGELAFVRGAVEWAHFESNATDLIVYLRNSASSVRAQNVTRARVRGEELTVQLVLPAGFTASGAATWMSALNTGPIPAFWTGKRLPLRPAAQSYARVQWRGGPVRAGAEVQFIGDNMLDPYNRLRVPSRTLVGGSVALALPGDALTLTLEGRNLGDRRVGDVGGFPLPGRSVFVSIGTRFHTAPSTSSGA